MSPGERTTLKARWIFTNHMPAIENGTVHIVDGRIVEIDFGKGQAADYDLGDAAILPGFVNAHTHLDLSSFDAPVPAGGGFAAWLASVVAHRRSHAPSESAIQAGVEELIARGTALVGDIIGSSLDSGRLLADRGLSATTFHEVIGLRPERYEATWNSAPSDDDPIAGIKRSRSPHAPYSTHPEVYRRVADLDAPVPAQTHWFESEEEVEFLRTAKGPIREFLESIGAWTEDWPRTRDPWSEYFPAGRWTLVHANVLSDDDLDRLTALVRLERVAAVVYCPRTHAHFGHPPHRFREMLAREIPVALGTDSRASNPDLSVFREACWLANQFPDLDGQTILRMITEHGARALGWEDTLGDLSPGRFASLSVVRVPSNQWGSDPIRTVWSDGESAGVMVNGRWLQKPAMV